MLTTAFPSAGSVSSCCGLEGDGWGVTSSPWGLSPLPWGVSPCSPAFLFPLFFLPRDLPPLPASFVFSSWVRELEESFVKVYNSCCHTYCRTTLPLNMEAGLLPCPLPEPWFVLLERRRAGAA